MIVLHLVGGEVLRLVDDDVLVRDRAAADVGEGLEARAGPSPSAPRSRAASCRPSRGVLPGRRAVKRNSTLSKMGCIQGRASPDVAGQEADVAPHGEDRAAHQEPLVELFLHRLLEPRRDGQQRLAGPARPLRVTSWMDGSRSASRAKRCSRFLRVDAPDLLGILSATTRPSQRSGPTRCGRGRSRPRGSRTGSG